MSVVAEVEDEDTASCPQSIQSCCMINKGPDQLRSEAASFIPPVAIQVLARALNMKILPEIYNSEGFSQHH